MSGRDLVSGGSPAPSDPLRRLIDAGRADGPDPAQAARLLARLAPLIEPAGGAPGTPGGGPGGGSPGGAGALGAGAVGGGALGGGALGASGVATRPFWGLAAAKVGVGVILVAGLGGAGAAFLGAEEGPGSEQAPAAVPAALSPGSSGAEMGGAPDRGRNTQDVSGSDATGAGSNLERPSDAGGERAGAAGSRGESPGAPAAPEPATAPGVSRPGVAAGSGPGARAIAAARGADKGASRPAPGVVTGSKEASRGSTEIDLLDRAQRALQTSPVEALSLADEHARRFAGGSLAPEREVIAISALVALGRQDEARRRADRFRAEHPGSAYLRRIDVVLAP